MGILIKFLNLEMD